MTEDAPGLLRIDPSIPYIWLTAEMVNYNQQLQDHGMVWALLKLSDGTMRHHLLYNPAQAWVRSIAH